MKEDVLEQVVEDYLQLRGYFTIHNQPFKPSASHPNYDRRMDSVASDVDVVGYNPLVTGAGRVWIVSCKAWQEGFNPLSKLREMRGEIKSTGNHFRELWEPKWVEAFRAKVQEVSGQTAFHYSVAVTKLTGKQDQEMAAAGWMDDPRIAAHLEGCSFSFLTMRQMWTEVTAKVTGRPAPSEIGRLAQLLKAAGVGA